MRHEATASKCSLMSTTMVLWPPSLVAAFVVFSLSFMRSSTSPPGGNQVDGLPPDWSKDADMLGSRVMTRRAVKSRRLLPEEYYRVRGILADKDPGRISNFENFWGTGGRNICHYFLWGYQCPDRDHTHESFEVSWAWFCSEWTKLSMSRSRVLFFVVRVRAFFSVVGKSYWIVRIL